METQIGPYKVIREIPQDAIGQAFEAVDPATHKRVILKYLPTAAASAEILVSRLHSEADILARLNHPNIWRLFGFVHRDERIYLVMEFLEGQTLASLLKAQGRFEPIVALGLFHQMISAISCAHSLGVIHGNLRPSNILITEVGLVKILDFPVSYLLNDLSPHSAGSSPYNSPEQLRGDPPDARSDIYTLGMLLYELIVGRGPFEMYGERSEGPGAQLELIPIPPSIWVPNIPRWLNAFVLRAMAVSPGDRFQSTKAMARAMKLPIATIRKNVPAKRNRAWSQRCAYWMGSAMDCLLVRSGKRCVASFNRMLSKMVRAPGRTVTASAPLIRACARQTILLGQRAACALMSTSRPLLRSRNKPIELSKELLAPSLRIAWRRYSWGAVLLLVAVAEVFYFHGANLSLLLNSRSIFRPSLSEAVDAMYARIEEARVNTEPAEAALKEPTLTEERKEPRPKTSVRQTGGSPTVATTTSLPEAAEKLPAYRRSKPELIASRSEKQAATPLVDLSNKNEAVANEPTRPMQNSVPKTQLNVRWEN